MEANIDKEGAELNNKGKKKKYDEVVPRRMTFPNNPPLYTSPLPFPQRFRKTKLDEKFSKFLIMLKKLEINILFADALAQMPNYVKFMKEIISNKKKLEAYGTMNLSENCSAIIQKKLLKKIKDQGSFTIPCIIVEHTFCKTRENFNFLKKGKIVISVKIRNFSRSRMTKQTSPLKSYREI